MAAGLQALPPGLSNCLGHEVVNLLQVLEVATGVGFVTAVVIRNHTVGVWESLSQLPYIMEPDFGADSRIWDDILRQWGDYSEYLLARYAWTGATSPGLSIWNPFQGMVPIPQQPGISPPYKPPIGRANQLKAMLNDRDLLSWAPQVAPAICQPPLLSQS